MIPPHLFHGFLDPFPINPVRTAWVHSDEHKWVSFCERRGSIGDPTLADAILDRLVHQAHTLDLDGESLRKKEKLK